MQMPSVNKTFRDIIAPIYFKDPNVKRSATVVRYCQFDIGAIPGA